MIKNSWEYRADCGYPKFKDPRVLVGGCAGIMALITIASCIAFRTPEQQEALHKKICEKTGGRWVFDHWRRIDGGLPERVYGCLKDNEAEIQQARR